MGNIFRKDFAWLGGLGPKSRPYLIYHPNTINQNKIMMILRLFDLLKECAKKIKNSNIIN